MKVMSDPIALTADEICALVREYFVAYKLQDRKTIEQLIADKFSFTSPYDNALDRADYFRRCWPNSEHIRDYFIVRIVPEGDAAFVTYRAVSKHGLEFRNTEFFTFSGRQITCIEVYFGASFKDGSLYKRRMAGG